MNKCDLIFIVEINLNKIRWQLKEAEPMETLRMFKTLKPS